MSGYFTKIDPTRVCSVNRFGSFPPSEKASLIEHEYSSQEWAPLYLRRFRLEPENYRTAASIANVGALRASRINGNGATESTLRSPGVDGFAISMIERGAGRLILPGSDEPVTSNATAGLIYSFEPGTRATASDLDQPPIGDPT